MEPKKRDDLVAESPVTYEVYANLPDDGNRYEVASGQLELMSPGPTPMHQMISNELQYLLNSNCRQHYFIFSAPIDVILSDTEIRQPDLVMVHRSRQSIITQRGINGAPDLVVEISSEHSRRRDKVHKTKAYARYGVPEYWIVDLTNFTMEQYLLREHGYELVEVYAGEEPVHSDRLDCVSFTMNDLTRDLPEYPA
jgi:Uma2 family endonuclease